MEVTTHEQLLGLTLDFSKQRFRIHQSTFSAIHCPDFFRILVNPEQKMLVIEPCPENAKGAHRYTGCPTHHGSIELYSKSLMTQIISCAGIPTMNSVRLHGHLVKGRDIVSFRMDRGEVLSTLS